MKIFTYLWVPLGGQTKHKYGCLKIGYPPDYGHSYSGKGFLSKQVGNFQKSGFVHDMFSYSTPNKIYKIPIQKSWCWNHVKYTIWVCLKIGYPIPSSDLSSSSLWNSPKLWVPSGRLTVVRYGKSPFLMAKSSIYFSLIIFHCYESSMGF